MRAFQHSSGPAAPERADPPHVAVTRRARRVAAPAPEAPRVAVARHAGPHRPAEADPLVPHRAAGPERGPGAEKAPN